MNPLITVALSTNGCQSWIAKFELEFSVSISEVLQLIKNGEEVSIWIVWILVQNIRSVGEESSSSVVVEYFDIAI